MTLAYFIHTYGYWAIFIGTFFEGETILVLGGFAAHQGYLSLPWVILVSFLGTLGVDQLLFYLGRNFSPKILARRPSWQSRADKAQRLLGKFQILLILTFRFLYGLRTITPLVIGMSPISKSRFFLLNVISAGAWATVVGTAGYLFGQGLEILMGDLKRYEIGILGLITVAGISLWTIHLCRRRRKKNPSPVP